MKVDKDKNRPNQNIIFPIIKLGLILLILVLVAVFVVFLSSYETSAVIANRLAADGNLESFSPSLFQKIQISAAGC